MAGLQQWLFTREDRKGPAATLLIRLIVGWVFIVSGVLKFLYPNQGVGRFTKLGIPAPDVLAPFVGLVEIGGGLLLVLGLLTRLATLPLIIDMIVAIASSKLPLLTGPGPEPVAAAPTTGFWAFAYQARLDMTMLLAVVFLLVVGAGVWSFDAWLSQRTQARSVEQTVGQTIVAPA